MPVITISPNVIAKASAKPFKVLFSLVEFIIIQSPSEPLYGKARAIAENGRIYAGLCWIRLCVIPIGIGCRSFDARLPPDVRK